MPTIINHRIPSTMTPHEQCRPTFPLPDTAENRRRTLEDFPGIDEDLEVGFKVTNRGCGNCKRNGKHCTFGTGLKRQNDAKGEEHCHHPRHHGPTACPFERKLQAPQREEAIALIEEVRIVEISGRGATQSQEDLMREKLYVALFRDAPKQPPSHSILQT
ncbi:uncharacterized protein PAN0_053c6460 [Moesziomyces antarcticus]|uniref:Uncharacterized protein n=2 Tax=Pseudozyma antarctica TaxID=84753 RepID=A0A081CNH7_PSEA2|nr:uncharacterized protein PAN0_053c6460 [Moesziomyces antarcticus]GAK68223.1 hypothetical protein PAN0_053c6460 [Moesziomyces antarcticus]SPO45315.1 uncharacterized protein PSANT_03001 [Moesziomyces antarcticus]